MLDLIYILVGLVFFASCYGLMVALDRLKE